MRTWISIQGGYFFCFYLQENSMGQNPKIKYRWSGLVVLVVFLVAICLALDLSFGGIPLPFSLVAALSYRVFSGVYYPDAGWYRNFLLGT